MSVTDAQVGIGQAQTSDPGKSQFGVNQLSSAPTDSLTKEDVEREVHRVKSELGRQHADEMRKLRQERDTRELESVKDNPEVFDALKARQEAGRREDEATGKLAEAMEMEERAIATLNRAEKKEAQATARDLGTKYGVDPTLLLTFTEGKVDKMEALAKLLPKVQPGVSGQAAQSVASPSPFIPDSGLTVGGGNLSLDSLVKKDIRHMTPSELKEHRRLLADATRGLPRR